ncbi:hypothetical protein [Deinococcus sp. DB0503]|uniref:hypothetical protein n=1 Tax=Deinococcus sp. DB0503 TaxID=2479203 RepID=UPI0018DF3644|nr:hypothetical protein [Deinococcus sp. DB0503]MBI0446979.1 hypothetical protein [Deinococcus sp. DB0503]
MDFDQSLALADRLFVTACRGNLSGGEYLRARYLLYLVKCHRQHFWLHGLHGRDIGDLAIQNPSPERTTRARLRELAQLARDARQVARPYCAFEALHNNV